MYRSFLKSQVGSVHFDKYRSDCSSAQNVERKTKKKNKKCPD